MNSHELLSNLISIISKLNDTVTVLGTKLDNLSSMKSDYYFNCINMGNINSIESNNAPICDNNPNITVYSPFHQTSTVSSTDPRVIYIQGILDRANSKNKSKFPSMIHTCKHFETFRDQPKVRELKQHIRTSFALYADRNFFPSPQCFTLYGVIYFDVDDLFKTNNASVSPSDLMKPKYLNDYQLIATATGINMDLFSFISHVIDTYLRYRSFPDQPLNHYSFLLE